MEEYARHLESHLGEAPAEAAGNAASALPQPAEGPGKQAVLEFLNARIAEIKTLHTKLSRLEGASAGIDRIVRRLEEITQDLEPANLVDFEALDRDLAILDETLVRDLQKAISPEQIAAWEQEAKKELRIYRKKLPKETYGKIVENFLRTKVHRHFTVGELSLFHM
jgi:hypothetical protein